MSIGVNLSEIKSELSSEVELVVVSKTYAPDAIMEAYAFGHRHFGENKIQELCAKQEVLPKDIKWHLIGHVQTNKVKYVAPFVHLIHAVDSLKLLNEVDKRAAQNERVISCLLQVHIADEEDKFGFNASELIDLFSNNAFSRYKNISIRGLMGMATFSDDSKKVKAEFEVLKRLYDQLAECGEGTTNIHFETLSMGMSGDYKLALESGSNMIRVGSAIFGKRG
jgi:PLP dependent protein